MKTLEIGLTAPPADRRPSSREAAPAKDVAPAKDAAPAKFDELIVTGLDAVGEIFHQPATVQNLDGAKCVFLCKSQPNRGASLLLQFSGQNGTSSTSHGEVTNWQTDKNGLYRIEVQLEGSHSAAKPAEARPVVAEQKPSAPSVAAPEQPRKSPAPALTSEPASVPAPAAVPVFAVPQEAAASQLKTPPPAPRPAVQPPAQPPAAAKASEPNSFKEVSAEWPELLPQQPNQNVALEVKQQLDALKNDLLADLMKALPGELNQRLDAAKKELVSNLSATLPETLSAGLDAKVSSACQSAIEKLGAELNTRMAANAESLRTAIAADLNSRIAKGNEPLRAEIAADLNSRMTPIVESLRTAIANDLNGRFAKGNESLRAEIVSDLNGRFAATIESLRATIAADLDGRVAASGQSLRAEIAAGVNSRMTAAHESLRTDIAAQMKTLFAEELNETRGEFQKLAQSLPSAISAVATIEKAQADHQARIGSAQAELEQLAKASAQAGQLNAHVQEMQKSLELLLQNCADATRKLGAGVQLAQVTISQCEKLADENAKSAAADFEKEIRAVLLRMAKSS